MRRCQVLLVAVTVAAIWGAGPLAAAGAANTGAVSAARAAILAAGSWGEAIEVPGLAALNTDGLAGVTSVSCGSAGNCAAGGQYADRSGLQGFVAVERNGVWGSAVEVPGLAALNKGQDAQVDSVSCGSADNCAAVGFYTDHGGGYQGFVAVERNGVWGNAIEVPGLAALNTGGQAIVNAVSCASAGNCAVGGDYAGHYADHHVSYQGFVAVEKNGRWGKAIGVPGLAALNKRGVAQVDSVSCGSAGNCTAGGYYTDQHIHDQGFVADERHGRWGRAIEIPGLAALNTRGFAGVDSVSCASAGNCAAGGDYDGRSGGQGFVAVERHGRWGAAIEVLGLAALNTGGGANVSSVSCPRAGTCAAGGSYVERHHQYQGFVVSQTG